MEIQDELNQTNSFSLINDENNNPQKFNVDMSSEDEYPCSSCYSELISIDTRKLWLEIAKIIKLIYQDSRTSSIENDISKAKEYVQILTQANAEILFDKIESIVLEHVSELRHQLLKHSQTYLKTSNDVQSFITYLLDQYHTFIQSAQIISNIVTYLEDNYLKSLHLTWLLYNKHVYETYVYMNKKVQQSMSMMIDLLQPTNEFLPNDCSPAVYTQLLNRFLTFDEEMSEIACLYKDSQMKLNFLVTGKQKSKKKKKCQKNQHSNAMEIPLTVQQDFNASSIGSVGLSKESSSISSFDEYLNDNNTTKKSQPKQTSEFVLPPKPPTKVQTDFRPLFTKTDIPPCPSLLSAKIQSVSFTAGTFGSITTNESARLNLNLSKAKDSPMAYSNLDQLIRQASSSPNEISALLKSKIADEKVGEFCCCQLLSDSSSCSNCMSLINHQRGTERRERLKIKISNKRTNDNSNEQTKSSTRLCDNNIDDLVKFIDGNDSTTATTTTTTTKKKKKKKDKQKKTKAKTDIPIEEDEEKSTDQSSVPTAESLPSKKPNPPPKPTESVPENPLSPEEEINWITISRKQSKQKTIPAPKTPKPKQQTVPIPTKTKNPNTQVNSAQTKETVINSNKTAVITNPPVRPKSNTGSPWMNLEQNQIASTSTLIATAPAFVPSASRNNEILPSEQSSISLYWDPNGYLLPPPPPPPPGPVQRPNTSFSPAPGARCIRRPSPTNSNPDRSQWIFSHGESSTIPDDFPLYDPFNSGASLNISPSSLLTNGLDDQPYFPQTNDIDEMDAFDKEIQHFKKSYIETIPYQPRENLSSNNHDHFIPQ